jgi:hypothetical protein
MPRPRAGPGVGQGSFADNLTRVGRQTDRPRQAQAVQEKLTQAELIFLIRLCGFNPRAGLAQQLLADPRTEGNRAGKNLMVLRPERKFPQAGAAPPAPRAQWPGITHARPMPLAGLVQSRPAAGLALFTHQVERIVKARRQKMAVKRAVEISTGEFFTTKTPRRKEIKLCARVTSRLKISAHTGKTLFK